MKHGLHLIQEITWNFEGGMAYTKRFSHRSASLNASLLHAPSG